MNLPIRSLQKCSKCGAMLPPGAMVCPRDGARAVEDNPFGDESTVRHSQGAPSRGQGASASGSSFPVLTAAPAEPREREGAGTWEETVSRDVLVGKQIGDFIVKRRIGAGGMGIVYEGEHPIIGRKAAIKILRPDFSEGARARDLVAEARAASAIRHRGIIDIFGFGTLPGIGQYMVMEYLEGAPLDDIIAQRAPMLEAEVIPLLDELLAALAAAHAMGVIHRDLKPGNIFVVRDSSGGESVKVLDFGLAKRSEVPHGTSPQTRASLIVGTPEYMAPEQASGQAVGPHTDLYSVGVIAFEMLTRGLPFNGPSAMAIAIQHVQSPPPAPSSFVDIHPEMDALVLRMLAKEPSQRPASADAVRRELRAILKQLGDGATRISPPPHASPPTEEVPSIRSERSSLQASGQAPAPVRSAPRNSRPEPDSVTVTRTAPGRVSRPRVSPLTDEQTAPPTRVAPTTEDLAIRPTHVDAPATHEMASARPSRLPMLVAAGGILVLALGGLGFWALRSGDAPVEVPPSVAERPARPLPETPPKPPTVAEVKPVNPSSPDPSAPIAAVPSEPPSPPPETPSAPQAAVTVPDPKKPKSGERTGTAVATRPVTRPSTAKSLEADESRMGTLRLKVAGGWATIKVDGKEEGVVPPLTELDLPEGEHVLELINPGMKPYRAKIKLRAGQTLVHSAVLQPTANGGP